VTKEAKLGYLAGIVDGEGCVAINRVKKRYRNGRETLYYRVSVVVVMTDKGPLEILKNT